MSKTVVLVIRARDAFSDKLIESGFEVINLELLRVVAIEGGVDLSSEGLKGLDGLFFTSPHAAERFLEAFEGKRTSFDGDIYVLGHRTRDLFDRAGITVRYQSQANTAAEMITLFGEAEFAGKRLLYIRGDKSMRTIPDLLSGIADIRELVVYKTVPITPDQQLISLVKRKLGEGGISWACFFSPSGVDSLLDQIDVDKLKGVRTAVIGDTTARSARKAGFNVELISSRAKADDFAAQLTEHIKNIA